MASNLKTVQKPVTKPAAPKAPQKPVTPSTVASKANAKPAQTKPASKPAIKPEATITFHVPRNRPSSGALLFAYTFAVMRFVLSSPVSKREAIASRLHGASAMRHHGENGTRNIMPNKETGIKYNESFFAIGPNALDDKRKAARLDFADCFGAFIKTGKLPTGKELPKDFSWKEA